MKTLLLFALLCVSAFAQQCTETSPCQQIACEYVSGYCENCAPEPLYCDTTGYACDEHTVWTDWWFGTTCSDTMVRYCLYGPCQSFLNQELTLAIRSNLRPASSPNAALRLSMSLRGPVVYRPILSPQVIKQIKISPRFWWHHLKV